MIMILDQYTNGQQILARYMCEVDPHQVHVKYVKVTNDDLNALKVLTTSQNKTSTL